MLKRIVLSGALGFVVLLLWTLVSNGLFGITARVEMGRISNEREVYEVLKESIVTPGVYMANPALTAGERFPAGDPVFSICYSGFGHEAARHMLFVDLALALVALILTAGLLSVTSERVLSRFSNRFVFIVVVGLLLAVFGDLSKYRIGGYPLHAAALLAGYHAVSWALAGLAMAWSMRVLSDAGGAQ